MGHPCCLTNRPTHGGDLGSQQCSEPNMLPERPFQNPDDRCEDCRIVGCACCRSPHVKR